MDFALPATQKPVAHLLPAGPVWSFCNIPYRPFLWVLSAHRPVQCSDTDRWNVHGSKVLSLCMDCLNGLGACTGKSRWINMCLAGISLWYSYFLMSWIFERIQKWIWIS